MPFYHVSTCRPLYVQIELHAFVTIEQGAGAADVVLVDVDVAKEEGDGLQGQVYLARHQVEVVDVRGQAEVGIGAALVGGYYQLPIVNLELHEAQAGCLVALGVG